MADPRLSIHQNFDLIRCNLCMKVYQEPKLLPCLHSFCLECLQTYINNKIAPSESSFPCPICQEMIALPSVGGAKNLTTNQILKRYIDQTHRDETMKVAGREVLAMQRQTLTEEELQSPAVQATIQHIADTASHVIANGVAQKDKVHNFDTVKDRLDLQARVKTLQDQSIGIVHSIDNVNQGMKDWTKNKSKMREMVKNRSLAIQDTIRSIEKDLLARIDDPELDITVKDETNKAKGELHKQLKANITIVDFIRLLKEHGTSSDIAEFLPLVSEQQNKLLANRIYNTNISFGFEYPHVDLRASIELMFGTLSEISEEGLVWDPAHFEMYDSAIYETMEKASNNTVEEGLHQSGHFVREDANLNTVENLYLENGTITPRSSRKFNTDHRRRPLKSISFDSSTASLMEPAYGTSSSTRSGNQIVYDTDETNNNENETQDGSNTISNAITALKPSINLLIGQRPNFRRGSAPPSMIIDTLTRRRLSALSILERANIKTDGLLQTSDVESGLSQARLEWLRENVKRNVCTDGQPSSSESDS